MSTINVSTFSFPSLPPLFTGIESLYPVLYLAITIAIIIVVYGVVKKVLKRLEQRRVISKRVEGVLELVILIVAIAIAIPLALSSYAQYSILFSVVILSVILLALVIAFRDYIANAASYLVIISSGVVKDGERVRVVINGVNYEGKVELLDNGFIQLIKEDGTVTYIPYRHLIHATIVKFKHPILRLRMRFRGHGIVAENLVERIREMLERFEGVAEVYDIRPLELREEHIVVRAEVGLKKEPTTFLLELYRRLPSEMQCKCEVEVL
jgi:small-conductance mechanosensitive channel